MNAWAWAVAAVVLVVVFVCGMGAGSILTHQRHNWAEDLNQSFLYDGQAPDEGQAPEPGPGRHRRLLPPDPPGGPVPEPELAAAPVDVPGVDGPAPAPFTTPALFAPALPVPAGRYGAIEYGPAPVLADVTSPKFPILRRQLMAALQDLTHAQLVDVILFASARAPDVVDKALDDLRDLL